VVVVRVAQPRERGIILVECFISSDLGLMVFSHLKMSGPQNSRNKPARIIYFSA
jgi:hypothetical protein